MSENNPSHLAEWLPANPDLLQWDSITGVALTAGNAALRLAHATHLSLGQEVAGIAGTLEIEMSNIAYHLAGYQLSGPQVEISRTAYESVQLDMFAELHGGTQVRAEAPYKVLSISEHDPLQSMALRQQVSAEFKDGALVLDVSKGEDMRLAVSDAATEQVLAGEWLRQQLTAQPGKLDYLLVGGEQGQPALALKSARLGAQADGDGKGDTLVVFASSQYGRDGDLPNVDGFPRLLADPPEPDAAVQLLSSRLLHRNAFVAGFTQMLEGGRFCDRFEDGQLVEVVADAGTLAVPPTVYQSSQYTFTGEAFRVDALGGLAATFELDMATQQWNGQCTIAFSCLPHGAEVPLEFTAEFELSLRHRLYLLANPDPSQGWLEGQFFSPWPEAQEARALRGLPEGEENEQLRWQAEDFAAYAVKRAILLALAQKLDGAPAQRWLSALAFGTALNVQPEPTSLAFPGALSVSGALSNPAGFVIRDDAVNLLAGSSHEFSVDNPQDQALTWTLQSLPGGPTHPGSFDEGKYQAPPAHTLQRRSGQVLVIASNPAGQRSVAVVTVLRQALTANPFITVMQAGTQRTFSAGVLDVAALGTNPLSWTMLTHDPEHSGETREEDQGQRCVYSAKAADPASRTTYWLESLEVASDEPLAKQTVHVLVTQRTPGLVVALADEVKADGNLQFVAYLNGRPVQAVWSLAVGTGQIERDTGLYEPARSGPQSPGILVFATFDSGDFGVFEGHQIMPLQTDRFTTLTRQLLAPSARLA